MPDLMKTATVFRIAAWLSAALFFLNGGIVLFDGVVHSERLQTQYQITTLIVGVIFVGLSVAIFGPERSLTKIHRFQAGLKTRGKLVIPWRVVHLILGLAMFVASALMAGVLIVIIERLSQGISIFG